jgi:basic membrane lipoprotein Med (substrate-binding protein (PBP1-ABC) superfamily)
MIPHAQRRVALALAVAGALLAVTGCGTTSEGGGSASSDTTEEKGLKVGLVYLSGTNDQGWSQAFDAARVQAQERLAGKVETTFKQNVPDGPEAQRVMEQLIRDGHNVIIGTSFGQQQGTIALAKKHPDVRFLQVEGGAETLPNLGTYDINAAQGFYVAGMAAAAASKRDVLGVVGGFPIPPQLAILNAYTLGAQRINPDAKVRVVWTSDWDSNPKAQSAARALVNNGVGALTHFTTGPAVGQVGERAGIPWISYEVNLEKFGPQNHLTSVVYNWAPYLTSQFEQMIAGDWKPEFTFGGIEEGVVELAPWGKPFDGLSAAQKQEIEQAAKELEDGTLKVLTGPVVDRDGKERIPEGRAATPQEIYSTDYVVKGVLGSIPSL